MKQATPSSRVVFVGGGTGGHLFPAIAIADRVRDITKDRADVDIAFVGTRHGLEYRIQETLGYPLHLINIRGLARSFTLKNLLAPFIVAGALVQASRLLQRLSPALVVGTGGYVSWPVVRVAALKRIAILLQEQNSYPGIATRALARYARRIYLGFDCARTHLKTSAEIVVSGNPVRSSIVRGDRAEAIKELGLHPDKKTILVLGGSQGARAVNNAVSRSLEQAPLPDNYQLLWQTGKRGYTDVAAQAGRKAWRCTLFPFAERMDLVYAAADIAVARAGALTLAELMACGIPSILIPYPHAAGDHQRRNAQDLIERNMAIVIEETQLAGTNLLMKAVELHRSDRFRQMKQALRTWSVERQPAADIIAEDIVNIVEEVRKGGQ
ncbi:MAG: undecaprenyldiphospho-muramoylpentapeptide beta-N-acetylglucosaminyltransferase [Candidatus Zixiibacteriota bacterium]